MRLIPIGMCKAGMKLGKRIYNEEGLVLLAERIELTNALIRKLEQHGVAYLYIEDSLTDDIAAQEAISQETRRLALSTIRSSFRQLMMETAPRRAINAPFIGKAFKDVLRTIIDDLQQNPSAMIMLAEMSVTDHYLYNHSLNVCIYATIVGMASGYGPDELTALGLGALLHDIGKTKIPQELLNKAGRLNEKEWEQMKRHTDIGFRLLKDEPNIPLLSAHCALQHHERVDGSGYPRSLRGGDIHEYARWVGLIDAYDAMTSHRIYRQTMLPHAAMEELSNSAGTLFDAAMVERFRTKVALYPIGLTVRLSTGETGVVVDQNSREPQRPVVRVFQDAEGQDLQAPFEIDLSKRTNVTITAVNPPALVASRA